MRLSKMLATNEAREVLSNPVIEDYRMEIE
jgi:phosphoribosylformylglycinamidine (FGAM) synthase PurS component